MEFSNNPSIDLIIGPMFSGKTTELLRCLTISAEAGCHVLYINSSLDTRGDVFSTHNRLISPNASVNMDTLKTDDLMSIISDLKKYDVIGIDEAQFFSNLKLFCTIMADQYSKKVIVCGLNGDFHKNPFGELNDLVTHCDTIVKLYPFCKTCSGKKIMTRALFSKRLSKETDKIVIGDGDTYIPVCRECYKE